MHGISGGKDTELSGAENPEVAILLHPAILFLKVQEKLNEEKIVFSTDGGREVRCTPKPHMLYSYNLKWIIQLSKNLKL